MAEFIPDTIKLQGKDYLEVAQRVLWLRTDHADAQILTDIVSHDPTEGYAVMKAIITIPSTGGIATGYGTAARKDLRGPVAAAYLEKAETRAVGRACAGLGYGTLAAMQEDGETLADAPVARKPPPAVGRSAVPKAPTSRTAVDPPMAAARKRFKDAASESGYADQADRLAWVSAQIGHSNYDALTVADWDRLAGAVVTAFMDGPTRTWDRPPMVDAEQGEAP